MGMRMRGEKCGFGLFVANKSVSSVYGSIVMAIAVEGKERWEGVDNRRMVGKNSNWGRVESVYSGKVER